jgi:hypothetical protein
MVEFPDPDRRQATTRVLRAGEPEPPDLHWQGLSLDERIEEVWNLTKLAYAWRGEDLDALPLQRSVTRVQHLRR